MIQTGQGIDSLESRYPQVTFSFLDACCMRHRGPRRPLLVALLKKKYSTTSATSDAVLLFHCICFAVGEGTAFAYTWLWAMDNAAGRAFFHHSGVGQIRHISVRVLWVLQARVKEGFLTVGKSNTKTMSLIWG